MHVNPKEIFVSLQVFRRACEVKLLNCFRHRNICLPDASHSPKLLKSAKLLWIVPQQLPSPPKIFLFDFLCCNHGAAGSNGCNMSVKIDVFGIGTICRYVPVAIRVPTNASIDY